MKKEAYLGPKYPRHTLQLGWWTRNQSSSSAREEAGLGVMMSGL